MAHQCDCDFEACQRECEVFYLQHSYIRHIHKSKTHYCAHWSNHRLWVISCSTSKPYLIFTCYLSVFAYLHGFKEKITTISKKGNYVRLLFIDYSSAFNTIVPIKLAVKLSDLDLNTSLCDWIQDFLTARPQVVKVDQFTSNSITLNIGAPQGCVLSPLLYSLYTHDCVLSQLHFYR